MHSIRYRMTAITIVEILVAILCVYVVSYCVIQTENDQRSVQILDLLAQDTGKSLEEYTTGIERSVDMISNLATDTLDSVTLSRCDAIGEKASGSRRTAEQQEELDTYLSDFARSIQVDFAAVAEHTHGVATYHFTVQPNIASADHGFYYSHVGRTGFYEREPFDPLKLDPNDPDHSGWYFTPVRKGRPSWVGPFPATSLDEMLICTYIVPVYKSGTLIGTLGMDIPRDTLVALVSSIHVYDTGFACLLDAKGNVIYHPEQEYGTPLDLPFNTDVLQQEDSAGELIRFKTETGEEVQMAFTTLSTGMKLMVIAPTEEVNAAAIRLTRIITPFTVVVVAIISLLSLLVLSRLTHPLQRLTAAAHRIIDNDYDVELDYHGNDEVGALTSAFLQMRNQVAENIEDLNRRARTDDLTGLPNQRHFFELATEERDRLLSEGKQPAMLFFNLTGMKNYNRQYGFSEGDKLICEVAQILADQYGKERVSRFGQDHFAVVSDEERLEERIHEVFKACEHANGGRTLPVSVGIYLNSVGDVEASVACDRAKYACDRLRGTYVSGISYFDSSMQQQIATIRYVISHLDEAIEKQWIQVFFQPIVRAVNGRVCDEEALSRWIDPEKGFLSPGDFIPALENAGLIYRLDLYVLDQILTKMLDQQQLGLTVVSHSINLSRSDFDSCDIVEEICTRVDAAGIDRKLITIEITESIIGQDFDFMKGEIERFQSLGFPVWIDDFGSGYSSLDFLQSIAFDLIKFDMSFLRNIDKSANGKIILTELMRMATSMGVDTICEGVETEDQVRFLREIGCSKLQGFYYCKAISLEEIAERHRKGIQIGYENPEESDYFESIGKVNLHNLSSILGDEEEMLQNAFNMVPMAVMEQTDDTVRFTRTNQAFRDFMNRYSPSESFFTRHVQDRVESMDSPYFFDGKISEGSIAHCMMRHIRTNPVTGTAAIVIAIVSIA